MHRKTYINLEKIPDHLRLSDKKIEKKIQNKVIELKNYFQRFGFKKALVGVSGGLDSSVSAALVVKALGAKNVYMVRMPYCGSSSPEGLKSSTQFSKNLKLPKENLITIPINSLVDFSWKILKKFKDGNEKIRKGNLMARKRMEILFDLSSAFKAIVVGTENKTEERLGYYTIGGDHLSGIEPILDLWKTQVFQLAEAIKEIPESILNRTPSPEFWKSHTDEGEIGASYLEIDTVLSAKEELNLNRNEINQKFKIPLGIINLILGRAKKAEGKRNLPRIL